LGIQTIMQVMHAVSASGHPDKNGRSNRDKSFNVPEKDLERFNLATDIFKRFQRRHFPALQSPGRKNGHMSGQMGQIGVQLLPEVLNKFPYGIPYIGHQGITGTLHVNDKLYLRRHAVRVTTQERSARAFFPSEKPIELPAAYQRPA
jgi:hypothetical protein